MGAPTREAQVAEEWALVAAEYETATIVLPANAVRVYTDVVEIVKLLHAQAKDHIKFQLDPTKAVPGFVTGYGYDPKVKRHYILAIDGVDPENVATNV